MIACMDRERTSKPSKKTSSGPTSPAPREASTTWAIMGSHSLPDSASQDLYRCPQGQVLRPAYRMEGTQEIQYRADAATCNACPVKAQCTESLRGRHVHRSFFADYVERVKGYQQTLAYQKALNKRKVWVEPLFAEGKQWHGMERFRGTRGSGGSTARRW